VIFLIKEEFENIYDKKFDFKKLGYALASTLALAFAILLIIGAINYFNKEMNLIVLTNLNVFLIDNWFIIVGFVLFIELWDFFYNIYRKQLRIVKPLVEVISTMFAIWLISVLLNGLRVFLIPENNAIDIFLKFPYDFLIEQFAIIFLLILFGNYAKYFFSDSKRLN
jgi:hypothetical protein